MSFNIMTRVDEALSVDPSYIVRYQLFEDDRFLGDGVVQYHRLARHNDFSIPGTIRLADGRPLPEHLVEEIKNRIQQSVIDHLR